MQLFDMPPTIDPLVPERVARSVGPLVVNLSTRPRPRFDRYVGRDFAGMADIGFGNPFPVAGDGPHARAAALVQYWEWLNEPGQAPLRARIRSGELTGTLGCWCSPKLCHGHLLAALTHLGAGVVRRWVADLHAVSAR